MGMAASANRLALLITDAAKRKRIPKFDNPAVHTQSNSTSHSAYARFVRRSVAVTEASASSVPADNKSRGSHPNRFDCLPSRLDRARRRLRRHRDEPAVRDEGVFFGSHSVPPTHENVLGVLSLIIYSLLLVVSVKYVAFVLRADNQGEGGILALTALVRKAATAAEKRIALAMGRPILIALGIFGTALLYGDGMITPAISVLGAVEGLEVATPLFSRTSCRSPW